jgi:hypothetical protein
VSTVAAAFRLADAEYGDYLDHPWAFLAVAHGSPALIWLAVDFLLPRKPSKPAKREVPPSP